MSRSMAVLSLGVLALGVAVRRTNTSAVEVPNVAIESPKTRRIWAEGRVVSRPGAEVHCAPEIGGLVASLSVKERAAVKKGDLVCELASDSHRAALAEAKARIVEADADIEHLAIELDRANKMLKAELLSAQALQKTKHDLELARARKATASAAAAHSEVLIAKTRIVSPIDGMVVRCFAQEGETVMAGTKIAKIIDLAAVRVEAEIDEFDAVGLEVGAKATISAEGHAKKWSGKVEELPDVIVSRSLEREGPGEPQGTHVLLAKVELATKTPLRLGQRVEVSIELDPADSDETPASAGTAVAAATAAPAPTPVVTAPAPVAKAEEPSLALTRPLPQPDAALAAVVSSLLTIAGAGFTAFAIHAFRRRTFRLGERRLVRLGKDGVMLDHDVVLERHQSRRGKARVELATGGALAFRAIGEDGIEATPDGLEMSIEGVRCGGATMLVHGMVIAISTGDEPASYVYLDRAASHSEQERRWLGEDEGFLTAEGDSIADVWAEDEIYVFDDTNVTERKTDEEQDADDQDLDGEERDA